MPSHHSGASQLDGTGAEWAYRGRTGSELNEPQPLSAPTGLAAQRDEGFQRFYKAVVSPTHVRVTAGGRIVPNTRGSSPTSRSAVDRMTSDIPTLNPEQVPVPVQSTQYGGFTPMLHGYVPTMATPMAPAMMTPMAQMVATPHVPFTQMPMGFNMPIGVPPMSVHPLHRFQSAQQLGHPSAQPSGTDRLSEATASETAKSVQMPAAEPFNQARPSMYNGQWMMPPGHHYLPYGIMPPPAFQAPPMQGPVPAPGQMPMMPMAHPYPPRVYQGPRPYIMNGPPMSPSAMGTPNQTPLVPLSSIRPSEITKKQIETLKVSLRYLEDQLQFNKHQIDEKAIELNAQQLRSQIEHFEKNFELQADFEELHYPRAGKRGEFQTSSFAIEPNGLQKMSMPRGSRDEMSYMPQEVKERTSRKVMENASDEKKLSASVDSIKSVASTFFTHQMINGDPGPRKGTTLPTTAALAPPFQPRTDGGVARGYSTTPPRDLATPGYEDEVLVQPLPILNPRGGSEWKSFFTNASSSKNLGHPYLIGELADGVNPEDARDTDYSYVRELTEDELRARHMYWGKAPRSLQKGLPKYDGKNFYPPSPVKGQPPKSSSSSSEQLITKDCFQSLTEQTKPVLRNRFGNTTKSEALPKSEKASIPMVSGTSSAGSFASQMSPRYREFRKAVDAATRALSDSPLDKSSSDSGDDDTSLLFQGRRVMDRNGYVFQSFHITYLSIIDTNTVQTEVATIFGKP